MSCLRTTAQILLGFLTYITEKLTKWVPRNKNKWVFGAMGGFRDNPKFLFYETNEKHPEIRAVWIGNTSHDIAKLRAQGLEAYSRWSLKGIWHALTAKVWVCDHILGNINRYLTGGVFYVNLWHGSSVKRVRWQAPQYHVQLYHLKNESEMRTSFGFRMITYMTLFQTPDFCLAPSRVQAKEFFAPMMDISLDKCVTGVYPRSRLLIEGKQAALDFVRKYEPDETMDFIEKLRGYDKTYIYMPTWRNDKSDFIAQAGIDWQRLDDAMKAKNELFILKLHPFTKLDISALEKYDNILIYPPVNDIYTVLPFIDCLITDYSSIYTDFLMMDKEIILFVFDYDQYVKGSYDLAEYDKYFVGKRADNFGQLLEIIAKGEDCHVPKAQYDFLMDFFWDANRFKIDLVEEIKQRI